MSVFTKDDLRRLYESEVIIQQNKCVRLVVEETKQSVFSQAKEGNKSAIYQISTQVPYYKDEWVKTQIFSDLERIFPDSVIQVSSNVSTFPTLKVTVDWA
jgi:hypothetical protein